MITTESRFKTDDEKKQAMRDRMAKARAGRRKKGDSGIGKWQGVRMVEKERIYILHQGGVDTPIICEANSYNEMWDEAAKIIGRPKEQLLKDGYMFDVR